MNNYNQISGSHINSNTKLLFKEFEKENFYLAFLRSEEAWGSCALINISLPPNVDSITDILASGIETDGLFVDKNCSGYDISQSFTKIRIYKTISTTSDFNSNMNNYSSIEELEDVNLTLIHMNNSWCSIKGLPYNHSEFLNNENGNKYYIFVDQNDTYPLHPIISNMVKIKEIPEDYISYTENVKLVLSSPPDSNHSSRFDTLKVLNLVKYTSLLGEVVIKGLSDNGFGTVGLDETINTTKINNEYLEYVNISNSSSGFYFYLADSNNLQISPNLYLKHINNNIFNVDSKGIRYIIFTFKDFVAQEATLKITYESPNNTLAIFNEKIHDFSSVSDAVPPSLSNSYLRHGNIEASLFDIKNLIRLQKEYPSTDGSLYTNFSFVREIRSSEEKRKYIEDYGFTTTSKKIHTIDILNSSGIIRYGNIRPKPNGAPYLSTDKRLYLWSVDFIVGDKIRFRKQTTSNTYYPLSSYFTITSIDYNNMYIGVDKPLGTIDIIPSTTDTRINPQVMLHEPSTTNISIEFALCSSYEDALKFDMTSIMVDVQLGKSSELFDIYDGIYRQIAICHEPKYLNIDNEVITCTDISYVEDIEHRLFNPITHQWDLGTVVYLSNKQPLYRKFITSVESFTLII